MIHTILDCRLRDAPDCWVLCTCGEYAIYPTPEAAYAGYQAHTGGVKAQRKARGVALREAITADIAGIRARRVAPVVLPPTPAGRWLP